MTAPIRLTVHCRDLHSGTGAPAQLWSFSLDLAKMRVSKSTAKTNRWDVIGTKNVEHSFNSFGEAAREQRQSIHRAQQRGTRHLMNRDQYMYMYEYFVFVYRISRNERMQPFTQKRFYNNLLCNVYKNAFSVYEVCNEIVSNCVLFTLVFIKSRRIFSFSAPLMWKRLFCKKKLGTLPWRHAKNFLFSTPQWRFYWNIRLVFIDPSE